MSLNLYCNKRVLKKSPEETYTFFLDKSNFEKHFKNIEFFPENYAEPVKQDYSKKYNFKVTHTVRNKRVQGVISSEDKDFPRLILDIKLKKSPVKSWTFVESTINTNKNSKTPLVATTLFAMLGMTSVSAFNLDEIKILISRGIDTIKHKFDVEYKVSQIYDGLPRIVLVGILVVGLFSFPMLVDAMFLANHEDDTIVDSIEILGDFIDKNPSAYDPIRDDHIMPDSTHTVKHSDYNYTPLSTPHSQIDPKVRNAPGGSTLFEHSFCGKSISGLSSDDDLKLFTNSSDSRTLFYYLKNNVNYDEYKYEFDAALDLLLLERNSPNYEAYATLELANMFFDANNYVDSISCFERIIEIGKIHDVDEQMIIHANNGMAMNLIRFGDSESIQQAQEYYLKSLYLKENDLNALVGLGNINKILMSHFNEDKHLRANYYDRAIYNYEKALSLKPQHVGALNGYAQTLLLNDEVKKAYLEYTNAFSIIPNYDSAEGIEMCLRILGDGDDANRWLDIKQSLSPQSVLLPTLNDVVEKYGE